MLHFDAFFRANYLRIVRAVTNHHAGFQRADAEEVVSDVIHRYYDKFVAQIESPMLDVVLRGWMIRRACLDMFSRYRLWHNRSFDPMPEDYDALSFDDPADIVDLKQRVPDVPQILIEYEAFSGVAVTRALKERHLRAKKKFLKQLEHGA